MDKPRAFAVPRRMYVVAFRTVLFASVATVCAYAGNPGAAVYTAPVSNASDGARNGGRSIRDARDRNAAAVEASGRKFITAETQQAIDAGLAFLASRQHEEDGAFGSRDYRKNVAVTALAGMAFLSAGHTPGRGKYGDNVNRAVDYILSRCEPSGYIVDDPVRYHGPMYGHGFATLFLAEVYGMSPRKDVREKLAKAVKLIINSQSKEGGWRYHPDGKEADVSVTVCQIMALRAARNCGIFVPRETVDRCSDYVRRCQTNNGGFKYQLAQNGEPLFARSAAGVVALYSAGVYEGRELSRGLAYLMRYLPEGPLTRFEYNYYYGQYYAVQAMWHAGDNYWNSWYPAIRNELMRRQLPNGSWSDASVCTEYGTAMALLVLETPNNYLPIFQR